ncbi:MAG TPA: hypothetical protein VIO57_03015, partial [Chloroflexota bacterium]
PELPEASDVTPESGLESEAFDSEQVTAPNRREYSAPDSIEILARLERGEISVEEAMADLDALR